MKYKSFNLSLAWVQRLLLLFVVITLSSCQSDNQFTKTPAQPYPESSKIESSGSPTLAVPSMVLREGDTVSVSLPSSPTLDSTQQIRTDGKIVLPLVGEVIAAGKTPEDLQNELLKLYQPQVSAKQVIVTVQSPNIPVYVTGAVLRPGPVTVNHPISALDAVMEAGGFDYTKANLKSVIIVRQEKDRTVRYKLDLKKTLSGSMGAPFYLQPFDIVYVPERFTWY
jgi:protein involved in polysaccharide export with SLBB domain